MAKELDGIDKELRFETGVRCRYCEYFDKHEGQNYGECRRRSPTLGYNDVTSNWPIVNTYDWCGDFTKGIEDEVIK